MANTNNRAQAIHHQETMENRNAIHQAAGEAFKANQDTFTIDLPRPSYPGDLLPGQIKMAENLYYKKQKAYRDGAKLQIIYVIDTTPSQMPTLHELAAKIQRDQRKEF